MTGGRGGGQSCTYCKRVMEPRGTPSWLAATRDHIVPRSKGGNKTVWACRQCNQFKRDMSPEDWEDVMRCFPRWWERPEFGGTRRQPRPPQHSESNHRIRPKPIEETMRALGRGDRGSHIPLTMPKVYEDPKVQKGFENVYKDRLYLLRVPDADDNSMK